MHSGKSSKICKKQPANQTNNYRSSNSSPTKFHPRSTLSYLRLANDSYKSPLLSLQVKAPHFCIEIDAVRNIRPGLLDLHLIAQEGQHRRPALASPLLPRNRPAHPQIEAQSGQPLPDPFGKFTECHLQQIADPAHSRQPNINISGHRQHSLIHQICTIEILAREAGPGRHLHKGQLFPQISERLVDEDENPRQQLLLLA